jgi:hypothetical protein
MTGTAKDERLSLTYPFLEKILNLPLDLLCLFGVCAVGDAVWEWCARDEIYLVFAAT